MKLCSAIPNLSRLIGGGLFLLGCLGSGCGSGEADRARQDSEADRASPAGPVFVEVADSAGIDFVHQLADGRLSNIIESDGAGGTILDCDGDGYMDLYLVNSGPHPDISDPGTPATRRPNALYRNRGDGTFEELAGPAGVAGRGFGMTAAAADYDNDGDTDLYVVNYGPDLLYENRGDGTFREVTEAAGIRSEAAGIAAVFLDADRDGYLDLLVANYLRYDPSVVQPPNSPQPYPGPLAYEPEFNHFYHNQGDGTFAEVGEEAGVRIPGHRAMSATAVDYNRDGHADLYVSNDATQNLLLENDGHGRFHDVALLCGTAFNQFGSAGGSMGAAVGDANGDGLPDFYITRFGSASFYLSTDRGFYQDDIKSSGIDLLASNFTGWGGNFLDYDNDGDLDLLIVNGDPHSTAGMVPLLIENSGEGRFQNAATAGPFFAHKSNARGNGIADFDNDGQLDAVVTTLGGKTRLLHNRLPPQNHWILLHLEGTRSNRDGFGALVSLTAGGLRQYGQGRCPTSYLFQSDPRLHFGLGSADRIDRIEVRWPSGKVQSLENIPADQILIIREPQSIDDQ